MKISEVIRLVSNFSCLPAILVYTISFKKANRPIHFIGLLMITSTMADLITFFVSNKILSFPLIFNLQDIVQFWLVTGFYIAIGTSRKFVQWNVSIYLISLLISFWSQGIFVSQTMMWTISGVIIVSYGIVYKIFSLGIAKPESNDKIQDVTSFRSNMLITGGLLLYFGISIWLFFIRDYVYRELPRELSIMYWSCHNVNNILKNIIIGISIFIGCSKATTPH